MILYCLYETEWIRNTNSTLFPNRWPFSPNCRNYILVPMVPNYCTNTLHIFITLNSSLETRIHRTHKSDRFQTYRQLHIASENDCLDITGIISMQHNTRKQFSYSVLICFLADFTVISDRYAPHYYLCIFFMPSSGSIFLRLHSLLGNPYGFLHSTSLLTRWWWGQSLRVSLVHPSVLSRAGTVLEKKLWIANLFNIYFVTIIVCEYTTHVALIKITNTRLQGDVCLTRYDKSTKT